MVMYAGRQVEMGTTDEVFYESRHPYTLGLLATLPAPRRHRRRAAGADQGLAAVADPPAVRAARSTRAAASRSCPTCATPRCRSCARRPATRTASACHFAETLEASPSSRCAAERCDRRASWWPSRSIPGRRRMTDVDDDPSSRRRRAPLLVATRSGQGVPDPRRRVRPHRRHVSRGLRRVASGRRAARRSAWWGSPAAASPPPGACCST